MSEIGKNMSDIHLNAGSTGTVSTTADSTTLSPFPEVMNLKVGGSSASCTATVVGPYTVLTANHCTTGQPASSVSINWTDVGDVPVQAIRYNPYLNPTYTPSWWTTLNNQQKQSGGRQDDWPAQHDHVLLFVPTLTPAWLTQHNLTPASIGAPYGSGQTYTYNTIGVGSTGSGASRSWVPSEFVVANTNTITSNPRDGYLTENQSAANFGSVDQGDSGGPAMGFLKWPYVGGTTLDIGHFVVGTAQNTGGDKAPIAYQTGTTLTANQTLTVRLNSLFALAEIDDADNDGLPTACDANPASPNPTSDNVCPPGFGTPTGASLATSETSSSTSVPVGEVACKPGYMAIGMGGHSGSLVDQLSIHCQALSCFYTGSCSSGNSYWTDYFGGTGGVAFDTECASGSILTGVFAETTTGPIVSSLIAECTPISSVVDNISNRTYLSWVGASGTTELDESCKTNQSLVGFQARSSDARWVTALQPICSDDVGHFGPYMGGTGGAAADQSCPAGYISTGMVYATDTGDTTVSFTGVLCAPKSSVQAGTAVPDSQLWVVHGGAHDYNQNIDIPGLVEPYSSAHTPSGTQRVNCPVGSGMIGLNAATSSREISTTVVQALTSLTCRNLASQSVSTVNFSNAGSLTSAQAESSGCASGYVNGLYTQNGWLTDGLAPHCQ
jgi:hypothetical protein